MINKPAAWLVKNKDLGIGYMQTNEPTRMDKLANEYLPLYLHPAKTLTDEEITEIFDTTFEVRDYQDSFIKFARAVLKKASEK